MNANFSAASKEKKSSYNTQIQDYSGKRLYYSSSSKKPEQCTDQLMSSEFKKKDTLTQPSELSDSQGTLYSVSGRVPTVNTSCSNLCNGDVAYGHEQKGIQLCKDWEKDNNDLGEIKKGEQSEGNLEKHSATDPVPQLLQNGHINCGPASNNACDNHGPVIPICVYLHNKTGIIMDIDETPTASVDLMCRAIVNCDELSFNRNLASQVFTLWMISPLLELQLKQHQKPYEIRKAWRSLVEHYSHGSYNRQQRDEPSLVFQRNIFYPLGMEEKIKDPRTLELLYEEAKNNVINGRYPCENAHYIMLGGVQAHIELGPYNPQIHSIHYFREEQHKFLPMHVRKSATWTWLPISYKNSPEVRLLEHYKRVPSSATVRKLMKKYLEFCWTLPFYGAAFFEGQIEQPVRSLTSLITYHDIPVLVAINPTSVYVIDDIECTVLLGLRYEDFNWEYARPSKEDDPNCLPCLFLQFVIVENGARVSKILQVFSRQASLMDSLIVEYVGQIKRNNATSAQSVDDQVDSNGKTSPDYRAPGGENETRAAFVYPNAASTQSSTIDSLANKLSRLTLATFDENGHCIGRMGSWSYNY